MSEGKCIVCGEIGPLKRDKQSKTGFGKRCKKCVAKQEHLHGEKNALKLAFLASDKTCTKCGGFGPFHKQRGTKDGYAYRCKECSKQMPSRWPNSALSLEMLNKRRESRSNAWDAWEYGLKAGERQKLIEAQGGKCVICQEFLKLNETDVDHDHATGKVRGILCRFCNNMLGMFKETPDYLNCAKEYLLRSDLSLPQLLRQGDILDNTTVLGRKLYQRKYRLQRAYGITIEQFDWIAQQQHSRCAICKTELGSGRACHVDHNHKTGKVRGVLCIHCNIGIAFSREDIKILDMATSYLHNKQVNL